MRAVSSRSGSREGRLVGLGSASLDDAGLGQVTRQQRLLCIVVSFLEKFVYSKIAIQSHGVNSKQAQ